MRNRVAMVGVSAVVAASLAACNTFDDRGVDGSSKVVIPVDERVATQALKTLPSISGGTLAVTPDGSLAVAADPDRDRVSLVDLTSSAITQLALEVGDEPGRVLITPNNVAYVALRGSGALLTIDLTRREITARTAICAAPRGMGLQPDGSQLHVACAEGRLVSLDTKSHAVKRDLRLGAELRDVLPSENGLRVSTFKTSELLTLDANGTVVERTAPPNFSLPVQKERPSNAGFVEPELAQRPMQPNLAWRSLQAQDGSVMMLHQAATTEEIDITAREGADLNVSSPYGGGGSDGFNPGCQGVVVSGVSRFGARGPEMTLALSDGVLHVDMALSGTGTELAIVEAGTPDPQAPRPRIVSDPDEGIFSGAAPSQPFNTAFPDGTISQIPPESRLIRMAVDGNSLSGSITRPSLDNNNAFIGCSQPGSTMDVPGQATAVAYLPNGSIVVQSREPALVTILGSTSRVIELGGESVRDTGHDLFHRNSGGGIACASCHAEGAEDGHTWNFTGQGLRRTQALHVGLRGTAPFHWDGLEKDLDVLMDDVFVGRMGGVHQSAERVHALSKFLFELDVPKAGRDLSDLAAVRGKELFESSATGCTNCHNGPNLSDNKSYDVGTSAGLPLQVPSLRAISYRAPFIHTGCAKTLHDRFDPACGGDKHGQVAHLSAAQVDDLVAYLQTL